MLIQLTGSAETNINNDLTIIFHPFYCNQTQANKKRTKQNETQIKANIEQNQAKKKFNHH